MKLPVHPAKQLLEAYQAAYNQRDLEKTLALFAKKAFLWGTGIDETLSGLLEIEAQHKRDWTQSEKSELILTSPIHVSFGNLTWAAAVYTAKIQLPNGLSLVENLRGTITVEQEAGVWKISHMHASFPDARQKEGQSFPHK